MNSERSFRWLFWSLAILGLVLDLGSKYGFFALLYEDRPYGRIEVIPGIFDIVARFTGQLDPGDGPLSFLRTLGGSEMPEVNKGALNGFGQGNNLVFAGISVVAAIVLIGWSFRPSLYGDRVMSCSLGLILAGTLGNLFDRTVFEGVRDFIDWHYNGYHWPTFNIADCCLVCGASLLLVQAVFAPAPALSEPEA